MKKIIVAVAALLAVPTLALGVVALQPQVANAQVSKGLIDSDPGNVPKTIDGNEGLIRRIINVMLYVIGVIAVIMLIFGGIRYATSTGDSNRVTAAKNTILYSIVGLVVAIFAWAIVNFVVFQAGAGTN